MSLTSKWRRGASITGLLVAFLFVFFQCAPGRLPLLFLSPILLYGRVVDQHGEPVPDAHVWLAANNVPLGKSSTYSRTTDAAGRFSIRGIVGLSLAVEITKPGYRVIPYDGRKVTSSGMFDYGIPSANTIIPDSNAPVVFTLHKIEALEPLVKVGKKNFRLARDGTPLLISVDNHGGHQIELRCWNQELQRPPGQRRYDWRLALSLPGGGFLPRKDAFAFVAPQEGYVSSDVIDMPASLGNGWSRAAKRSYFVDFEDGTFARVDLEMHAGGDHFVVWESFFNPKAGSPNLENDPEKDARAR